MEKVKILIVEDEALIAESIREILEELGYEVCGMAMRAKEALELIKEDQPDLAILDINLKGKEDGIWLAEQIQSQYEFPYIFLTSFGNKQTIERAVKTQPSGYLIKPFKKVDIYSAIEVALNNFSRQLSEEPTSTKAKPNVVMKNSLFVKEGYLFQKLVFKAISHIKADDNYLEIYCNNKRTIIKSTMKDLLPKLPADHFVQTHRSWVVNIEQVTSFGANFLNVGETEIPVSNTFKSALMERFDMH